MHNVQNGQTLSKSCLLQDFESVSDHFGTLRIKGLKTKSSYVIEWVKNVLKNDYYATNHCNCET